MPCQVLLCLLVKPKIEQWSSSGMKGGNQCARFQFTRKTHSWSLFVHCVVKSHSLVSVSSLSVISFLQGCERYVHMSEFSRPLTGVPVIPSLGLERTRCIRVACLGWILHKPPPSLHSKPVRVRCHSVANTSPAYKNIQGRMQTIQSQA